ncbi:MAG TPA: type II secretion system protein [Tepidisphaeraceae bacterium]|nr:type II secretion system protein [Tepidisphaeraceae bacterium]
MNVRRRGFTLIEILVTIGILLLLVGIVVFSMSRVSNSSRNRQTQITLGNLKNMIAELEATAGLGGRQPPHMWVDGNAQPQTPSNFWKDADPTNSTPPEPDPLVIPQDVRSEAQRSESAAVRNTQLAMTLLVAVPVNKTALSNLPSNSIMKMPNVIGTNPYDESQQVGVPLDSWGNPIIFVPAGGLCGSTAVQMWIGGNPPTGGVVPGGTQQTGNAKMVVANPPAGSTTQVGPIRSPDGRPFWASAGPDGDFRRADDNLYSFEN